MPLIFPANFLKFSWRKKMALFMPYSYSSFGAKIQTWFFVGWNTNISTNDCIGNLSDCLPGFHPDCFDWTVRFATFDPNKVQKETLRFHPNRHQFIDPNIAFIFDLQSGLLDDLLVPFRFGKGQLWLSCVMLNSPEI